MNYTLLLLVFLLVILLWGSREGFVDFGLSGWTKPVDHYSFVEKDMNIDMNAYKKQVTDVTTGKLSHIIATVQNYAKAKTGPQGNMYDTRVMFYDQKNYFMTELMTKLLEKPGDDSGFQVASMRTQIPAGDASGPQGSDMSQSEPLSAFLPQIDILSSISPSKTGMEAVMKSISQDAGPPLPPGQPPLGYQS